MNINLTATGILKADGLQSFVLDRQGDVRNRVQAGFRAAAPSIVERVRQNVGSALKLRRTSFVKTYKVRHFDSRPDRMPAMLIGSTQKVAAIQESGGTVKPKGSLLLIPIGGLRVGSKTFKRKVAQLIASGNAFFKKMSNGTVILFAENIRENDSALRGFKRANRKLTGKKSTKRGVEVPIAVGVKSATLRKKTRVRETIVAAIPEIAAAINKVFFKQSLRSVAGRGR